MKRRWMEEVGNEKVNVTGKEGVNDRVEKLIVAEKEDENKDDKECPMWRSQKPSSTSCENKPPRH